MGKELWGRAGPPHWRWDDWGRSSAWVVFVSEVSRLCSDGDGKDNAILMRERNPSTLSVVPARFYGRGEVGSGKACEIPYENMGWDFGEVVGVTVRWVT